MLKQKEIKQFVLDENELPSGETSELIVSFGIFFRSIFRVRQQNRKLSVENFFKICHPLVQT